MATMTATPTTAATVPATTVPAKKAGKGAGKGARTRARILAVATEHFAALGARSASVPAIARQVGVSTSAVYAHFRSKDDLFAEAIDTDVAGLIAEALPEVVVGRFDGDFAGVLTRLFAALVRHPLTRRVLEGAEAGAMERLTVLPAELRLQEGIAAALVAGQRLGTVRADIDPVTHAAGLLAVVVALLVSLVQTDGQVDSQYATGAIAVLEAAIRPS